MNDIHKIQMLILRELLFNPNSRFSQLKEDMDFTEKTYFIEVF